MTRNIEIKKTPRLYRARVKMIEKIVPNGKKLKRRKWEKQQLFQKQYE
jgi:hypothetical protein